MTKRNRIAVEQDRSLIGEECSWMVVEYNRRGFSVTFRGDLADCQHRARELADIDREFAREGR